MKHLLLVAAVLTSVAWTAARAEGSDVTAPEPATEPATEPAEVGQPTRTRAEAIEDILSQPLDEGEYTEAVRCLTPQAYRNVRVLDDQHVLFEGPGDRAWLNRLRNRCIGLRPHATLRFRMRDSRICDLDTFEAVDTMMRGMDRVSATCSLGRFMPVTPEQVEAIRGAVDERRR
jgi:hypothetical protein